MGLPEFTAELSLGKSTRVYRGRTTYGNVAPGHSGIPAHVAPSQFDDADDLGDADDAGLGMDAGAEDADFGDDADVDADDFENGEDADLAGEDEGEDAGDEL